MDSAELVSGTVVARKYRLLGKLGQGGMGTVWEAEHLRLETRVALKLVDSSLLDNPDVLGRFSREAIATACLVSNHVVQVFDHDVWEGLPYLVMERLRGETLAARLLRVGRLDAAEALRIVGQVCDAANVAHIAGIVHRDLKPANIFLLDNAPEGECCVKVLDFGVAKLTKFNDSIDTTLAGMLLGTPCYMSPEQARGEVSIDHTSDLWSIAVIAFECLTGRTPFEHPTLGGLIAQICSPARPQVQPEDGIAPAFNDWFLKATALLPERRFQSAPELRAALRDALGAAKPTYAATLLSPESPRSPPPRRRESPGPKFRTRSAFVGMCAAAALLAWLGVHPEGTADGQSRAEFELSAPALLANAAPATAPVVFTESGRPTVTPVPGMDFPNSPFQPRPESVSEVQKQPQTPKPSKVGSPTPERPQPARPASPRVRTNDPKPLIADRRVAPVVAGKKGAPVAPPTLEKRRVDLGI